LDGIHFRCALHLEDGALLEPGLANRVHGFEVGHGAQAFLCIIAVDVAAQKVPNSSVSHASSSMQLVLSLQLFLFFLYPLQLSITLFLGQTFSWSELKSGSESFQRNSLHFLELLSLPGLDIPLRLKVPVH
jgi:hypothetical protein